jgi:predicted nuclease of predicted toxin-antitoxin system
VLVTLDNDFGELAVRYDIQHHGIIRVALTPVSREARVCLAAIAAFDPALEAGAIVTATPHRIRVRPAQGPDDS